ncbi:MAG TPA: hypothetical protein VFY67_09070 [Pyrinomonadaceae bacterium]|nr:hypothetical protein [Pyrinomonadaceae bacterium]
MSLTLGMRLTIITPDDYGLQPDILETAQRLAAQHHSVVEQHHRLDLLPSDVDAVLRHIKSHLSSWRGRQSLRKRYFFTTCRRSVGRKV